MSLLAIAASNGTTFGNVSKNKAINLSPTHQDRSGWVSFLRADSTGQRLAVVNASVLRVYNTSDWSVIANISLPFFTASKVKFSPDGAFLAVASDTSPGLVVVSTTTWSMVTTGIPAMNYVYCVDFNADSTRMGIAINNSPRFIEYDTATWAVTKSGLPSVSDSGGTLCYFDGGAKLAFGWWSGLIVFNTTDWSQVYTVSGRPSALDISPDGQLLATGDAVSPWLRLLRASDGSVLHNVAGLSGQVRDLSFSPAGDKLLVAHSYGTFVSEVDVASGVMTSPPSCMPRVPNDPSGNGRATSATYLAASGPARRIYGNVRDIDGTLVQRIVRAYDRSDGALCAETFSDPTTGAYELVLWEGDIEYDVQFLALPSESLNDLFYARVTSGPA